MEERLSHALNINGVEHEDLGNPGMAVISFLDVTSLT